MGARRLGLMSVAFCCGLLCALGVCAGSAVAAPLFGGFGTEAGQVRFSYGIAVNDATHDVYVSDQENERIDEFDASGKFLLAWGWGVANGAEELQTCTASCRIGDVSDATGAFCGPEGVAVDNDPLSVSYEDVYVATSCNGNTVYKFSSSGTFLLTFGGHVDKATNGNVCVVGEMCRQGTRGTADGEFEWTEEANFIAVDPNGDVYVGDKGRVQIFDSSGVWQENISLAGLSTVGMVTALAVNAAGDVFLKDTEVSGVREFEPSGAETGVQFDAGSESIRGITFDTSGDLLVTDTSGGIHFLEYDSAGKELESFGSGILTYAFSAMAFDATSDQLLIYGENENENGFLNEGLGVWAFTPPAPGPLLASGSESATPGQRGTVTLDATINPEGNETAYRFEYGMTSSYGSSTTSSAFGSSTDFEDESVSTSLTGLVPGETYHYRIVATNADGTTTGPDHTFTTVAPMLVDGPWVSDVASTSATIAVQIDPLGSDTEYRLEYGTSTSYGKSLSGNVGEGTTYVPVSFHRQELLPDTTYHYRVVASNEVGMVEGLDHVFTTQPAGGQELTLADGREWELVSPPDKAGGLIEPFEEGQIQAAVDGDGIAYVTNQPTGEKPRGNAATSSILAMRGPSGWRSEDISTPYNIPKGENASGIELFGATNGVELLSPNLTSAIIEPAFADYSFSLSPEAPERTVYMRNNTAGTYTPLVSNNNVPFGVKYGGRSFGVTSGGSEMHFVGASLNLSHIILESPEQLTAEVRPPECETSECSHPTHLFEWSAGELQLVSILPGGEPAASSELASGGKESASAVSEDGRWVVWNQSNTSLYVRDMAERKTYSLGGPLARFEMMSGEGSRIFVLEKGELYVFSTATDTRTDITADHGDSEGNASVKEAVLGISENGSYVYFVAKGVLAQGGVSGAPNVYVAHDTGDGWSISYVVTLSNEDEKDWSSASGRNPVERKLTSSRISPNGQYLAFMSNRSLTGYDNLDANSGQPDEEVFEYDIASDKIVCVSCNPTGARPVGVLDGDGGELLADRSGSWSEENSSSAHWLAGLIPGWTYGERTGPILHQPRYLSDSGRLFFDSPDTLVPQDTNGLMDVYEYEPVGTGSCAMSDVTFNEKSDGCLGLISSGTSASESVFLDASETGDDVFFLTSSRLTAADYDNSYDVYDAHVCSEAVPCANEPVSSPPCTSGDSCKAAPSPQPELFGSAPSATFSGKGNVSVAPSSSVTQKTLTNAQKLARALTGCHKKKNKPRRELCERQARKRYPTKKPGKAKAKKKGDR